MTTHPAQGAAPELTRVVCLGDSITDGDTYPQIIMQSLHDAGQPVPAFICAGVGSDTAKLMDARFDKAVAIFKPDLVTINAGTNDALQNIPAEDYGKSIRSIVAKTKAIGAKVLLLTPCECLAIGGKTDAEKAEFTKNLQSRLDAYEATIRAIAAENSCPVAETRKLMKESLKAGNNLFVEDRIHPNYLGQSLYARSILDALGHKDVALPKTFDPKATPGLVQKWMLRASPLDEKKQPTHLTEESVAKLAPDTTWTSCELPLKEPVADSAGIWPEQVRRNGGVIKTESLIGKSQLGQGVAEINSADGGQAFVQPGFGVATIWVNGKMVHDQMKVWTGAHPGKERIPVTLVKGANTIVIEFKDSFFLAVTPNLIWEDRIY